MPGMKRAMFIESDSKVGTAQDLFTDRRNGLLQSAIITRAAR